MGLSIEQAKGGGWKNAVMEKYREAVVKEWVSAVAEKREFDSDTAKFEDAEEAGTVDSRVTVARAPVRVSFFLRDSLATLA